MTVITKPFKNFLTDDDYKAGHNMVKYSDDRIELENAYDIFGWPIDPRNQISIFKWKLVNGYKVSYMHQLLNGRIETIITRCMSTFSRDEIELYLKKYKDIVDKNINIEVPYYELD